MRGEGEKVFEEVKRQENKWWQLAKLHQILLKRDAFKIILHGFTPPTLSLNTFSNHSLFRTTIYPRHPPPPFYNLFPSSLYCVYNYRSRNIFTNP